MSFGKGITIFTAILFFWTMWDSAALGFYVGTYGVGADRQAQCRYLTARGLFDETKSEATAQRSTTNQYCPSTFIFSRGKDAQRKKARI